MPAPLGRRYLKRRETVRENLSRLSFPLSESCRQVWTHRVCPFQFGGWPPRRDDSPLRCLCNPAGAWTHVLRLLLRHTCPQQGQKDGSFPLGP